MSTTKFNWTHIRNRHGEYPELFLLRSAQGDRIKVEYNRYRGLSRISADTKLGNHIQSIISNGIILREKDLNSGKNLNLAEYFADLSIEISSLPDSQVLRNIGGNYGILTEFLGQVENRELLQHKKRGNLHELFDFLFKTPRKILRAILATLHTLWSKPSFWDVIDASLISAATYYIYQINFNFLTAGATACVTAIATGLADWLLRKRDPYNLKILATFIPAGYAIYLGLAIQ